MMRQFVLNIGMGLLILVAALALKWASHQGLVGPQDPTRWAMVLVGLVMAVNANLIPKQPSPRPLSERALAIRRVAGWSMVLAGLGYAAAWAFVPLSHAADISMIAVGVAIVWVVGFCVANRKAKAYAA
jgi:cobalamin synthase